MSFLHKKIWIQSLQSLLASQDNYIDTICFAYSNVTLSQYSLRHPIAEMNKLDFQEAISYFERIESVSKTPLEKLAVLKTTLDLISSAVHDYGQQSDGNENTGNVYNTSIYIIILIRD